MSRANEAESTTAGGSAHRSVRARAAAEAKRYLAFASYLMVVFGTLILFSLNIYSRIDQDPHHFPSYHFYALGLINALVLAKFMLVLEMTPLGSLSIGRRLQARPLAYTVLYRAVLFAAILAVAYAAEEILVGAWHGRPIRDVLPEVAGGPRGAATFVWVMIVALIPYFAYRELGWKLGEARLRTLVFGR